MDVGVVTHPAVPVAETHPRGCDFDDDAARRRLGVRQRDQLERSAEGFVTNSVQRTPPIRLRIGLSNRNITTPAARHTPAVTPNSVGSGVVLMKPADHPASLLPTALERKKTPIMRPRIRLGASFVTTERPTG